MRIAGFEQRKKALDTILRHRLVHAFYVAGITLFLLGLAAWAFPMAQKPALPGAPSIATSSVTTTEESDSSLPVLSQYIQVVNSCDWSSAGVCVNMRSGPGTEYPVVMRLRDGMVLKVASTTVEGGRTWYKIGFDGAIRYPERVTGDWYVAADYVSLFTDPGAMETTAGINASSTKRIIIDLSTEMLYAYDGDVLFMEQPVSTGLEFTPTPRGTFWVYRKTPDAYMQGPLPGISDQYYDLPGVPWDLYFTFQGGAIHGAYWHNHFGEPWSHGCVNLPPAQAKILYEWADLGTPVIVRD